MKKTILNKNKKTTISVPTIRRLPLYLSFLKSIENKDKKFITAPEIARELRVDSTQITKDLSCINITGKTKIGYEVANLIAVIEHFLGYHIRRKAFVVGVGNLGTALIKFEEFYQEGMEIIKGFDIAKNKIGKEINNIEILNVDIIKEQFTNTPVDIGIIAVPADQTQKVADMLMECGVKAIWNFSTMPISAPDEIIIENTCIDSSLAMIKWKLNKNMPLIYKNRII